MAARAPTFVADALWHCLCPSFSRSLVNASARPYACPPQLRRTIRRVAHAATAPTWGETSRNERRASIEGVSDRNDPVKPPWEDQLPRQTPRKGPDERSLWKPARISAVATENEDDSAFSERLATPLLMRLEDAAAAANKPRVQKMVLRLIKDLGMSPDARIYRALLLAEADPWHGSAAEVERLLSQVDLDGITLDSAIYHAALKVWTDPCPRDTLLIT